MNSLKDRIISMIRAGGPMPVSSFMNTCLHDPRQGYYATQPGLGRDFITAPETSQIFGELIGLWAANEWIEMGRPNPVRLIEVGPGRGTLMADALRAARSVAGFGEAIELNFIEPSPVLRARLEQKFNDVRPVFLTGIEDIRAERPFILLANEWLDCLPARQFVRVGKAWHERVIGLDEGGELCFGLAVAEAAGQPETDGAHCIEVQPGLETLVQNLADRLDQTDGRALLIDYGPDHQAPEDTLRAYKDGQQVDPLTEPGLCDLTVDVDFGRLARLARKAGIKVEGPLTQGAFLLGLGAEARLNQLAKTAPDGGRALYHGVRKLVDPAHMGERFKVLALRSETV